MTENQLTRFQQIQEMNLKTAQAWVVKENFKEFFNSETINGSKWNTVGNRILIYHK